jgi:hypothetical protein
MFPRAELRNPQQSPVRIFGLDNSGRPITVAAWTMDVSHHGARVRDVHEWSMPGEIVGVRHGSEKARFRIVWVGPPGSAHYGQIGLLCVESAKYIWGVAAPQAMSQDHPASTPAFAAAAVQGGMASIPASRAAGNNRRIHARYRANGGVKLQEVGAATGQWATLYDLSMGGCYVETTNPLPVASVVDVTVHVGEINIQARGFVTVSHRLVGMGVQFRDVSNLNRTRLEQVMEILKATSSEA